MRVNHLLDRKYKTRRQINKRIVFYLKQIRAAILNKSLEYYTFLNPGDKYIKWHQHFLTKNEKKELVKFARTRLPVKIQEDDESDVVVKKKRPEAPSRKRAPAVLPRVISQPPLTLKKKLASFSRVDAAVRLDNTTKVETYSRYARRQLPRAPINAAPGPALMANKENFYRYADILYSSYWFGRLANMFTKKGYKKKVVHQMQAIMLLLKFKYQCAPLLILYELLEKLKPVFLLRKYKIRRTQLVEYPYVIKNSRKYLKALQWVRRELNNEQRYSSTDEILSLRVYNKLVAIKEGFSRHSLIKTRDIYNRHSNMSQFNIRYNWKRSLRW